jgi:predicted esterase
MSLASAGDRSPQRPSNITQAPNLSEENDLTGTASSGQTSDEQQAREIARTRGISNQECSSSSLSNSLPYVDTVQPDSLTEGEHATSILPHNSIRGAGVPSRESMLPSESASDKTPQLREAQQQPLTPTLGIDSASPFLKGKDVWAVSPAGLLRTECENIRRRQKGISTHKDGPPRQPEPADFPRSLSLTILSATIEPLEHCVLLLHQSTGDETSLEPLARSLRSNLAECVFISIRASQAIPGGNSGYHWGDPDRQWDIGFIGASRIILEDIIKDSLVAKCNFQPQSIVILGHGQGGMAALAAAASWNDLELGGVISIGGPIPTYALLPSTVKAKTPALILSGAIGDISAAALKQIKDTFIYTDLCELSSTLDIMLNSQDELEPLFGFLAHRLRREEWNKQAVISFGKIVRRCES